MFNKLSKYAQEGYKFRCNADGYQVWYEDAYIGGASIKSPREKRLTPQQREANIQESTEAIIRMIERHRGNRS